MKKLYLLPLLCLLVLFSLGVVSAVTNFEIILNEPNLDNYYPRDAVPMNITTSVPAICSYSNGLGSYSDGPFGIGFWGALKPITTEYATEHYSLENFDSSYYTNTFWIRCWNKSGSHSNLNREKFFDTSQAPLPVVPEFGLFIGMLTALSAVGIFFVVRRD